MMAPCNAEFNLLGLRIFVLVAHLQISPKFVGF